MRMRFLVAIAVTLLTMAGLAPSGAGVPAPRLTAGSASGSTLGSAVARIRLDAPTLAPMAYTRFCQTYVDDCSRRVGKRIARPLRLPDRGFDELRVINDAVNASIVPLNHRIELANETWLIAPQVGDCNDYAVTKRHLLLSRGWPPSALLLAEVAKGEVEGEIEHHLVLVVRTERGDLVLDNLTAEIMPWDATPYRWVRIQSPTEARLWARLAN